MPTEKPRILVEIQYHEAAQKYLRRLPLEHFMEATPQATQRKITLESLDLVSAKRPDIQTFNELLVQYPQEGRKKLGQVVPDNMVVVHPRPIVAEGSYDVPLQEARPFWMLEYVSKRSKRKDYDRNMVLYERDLKVPYYLLFVPDVREMTLYRMSGAKYVAVVPDSQGRCALPELELEVGLLEGWVRFWFRGDLLPLPADLLRQVEELDHALQEARRELGEAQQLVGAEAKRADDEAKRAAEQARETEKERQLRLAMEKKLAELMAENEQLRHPPAAGPQEAAVNREMIQRSRDIGHG